MKKAVIFDIGGTLEDLKQNEKQKEVCAQQLLDYLSLHDIHIDDSPEAFMLTIEKNHISYRNWGMQTLRELSPYKVWQEWYLKDYPIDKEKLRLIANNLATIREKVSQTRSLREDAVSTLDELKSMGLKLGVLSNTISQTMTYDLLIEYGIRKYFDSIRLSSISGYRKPHKGLFIAAARDVGLKPEECIYVGDTVTRDVSGARAAGYFSTIRITSELTKELDEGNESSHEDADHIITKLNEIPGLVKTLFS